VPLPHSPRRLPWLYIHAMHGQGSHAAARSGATDSGAALVNGTLAAALDFDSIAR
jgi:hypothetical protein